ncbi:MAG: ABC transporter permease [Candidatus Tectomicrobia bacterium]|nr:ABC transporter permease [Candidatus Tectomicrobia bacterium]
MREVSTVVSGVPLSSGRIPPTLAQRLKRKAFVFKEGLFRFSESRMALVGLLIFLAIVFMGVLAPLLATHDPIDMDLATRLVLPSREHWLGTDHLGRDIWSRIVYGGQTALFVGIAVVLIEATLALSLGTIMGYYGGKVDNIGMRFVEALLAFPGILLQLTLIAIMGATTMTAAIALGVGATPVGCRFVRGLILAEREKEYVLAAKAMGESDLYIMFIQLIPNIMSPMLISWTLTLSVTILTFAALTFLGLGPPPPWPSWGLMLNEARGFMEDAPLTAIWPGLAIMIAVMGINFFGDGLRDVFDPRLKDK